MDSSGTRTHLRILTLTLADAEEEVEGVPSANVPVGMTHSCRHLLRSQIQTGTEGWEGLVRRKGRRFKRVEVGLTQQVL